MLQFHNSVRKSYFKKKHLQFTHVCYDLHQTWDSHSHSIGFSAAATLRWPSPWVPRTLRFSECWDLWWPRRKGTGNYGELVIRDVSKSAWRIKPLYIYIYAWYVELDQHHQDFINNIIKSHRLRTSQQLNGIIPGHLLRRVMGNRDIHRDGGSLRGHKHITALLGGELPTNRLGGWVDPGFLNGIFVGAMSTYNWGELTHLRFVGWTTK